MWLPDAPGEMTEIRTNDKTSQQGDAEGDGKGNGLDAGLFWCIDGTVIHKRKHVAQTETHREKNRTTSQLRSIRLICVWRVC